MSYEFNENQTVLWNTTYSTHSIALSVGMGIFIQYRVIIISQLLSRLQKFLCDKFYLSSARACVYATHFCHFAYDKFYLLV
jgi:hypothetical protein